MGFVLIRLKMNYLRIGISSVSRQKQQQLSLFRFWLVDKLQHCVVMECLLQSSPSPATQLHTKFNSNFSNICNRCYKININRVQKVFVLYISKISIISNISFIYFYALSFFFRFSFDF